MTDVLRRLIASARSDVPMVAPALPSRYELAAAPPGAGGEFTAAPRPGFDVASTAPEPERSRPAARPSAPVALDTPRPETRLTGSDAAPFSRPPDPIETHQQIPRGGKRLPTAISVPPSAMRATPLGTENDVVPSAAPGADPFRAATIAHIEAAAPVNQPKAIAPESVTVPDRRATEPALPALPVVAVSSRLTRDPAGVERRDAQRRAANTAAENRPIVQITIGRVEVHADKPTLEVPRSRPPQRPKVSLEEFLRRRNGRAP
jgi:hypothetical protein